MIVSIEGIDGAGKQTQAEMLAKHAGYGVISYPTNNVHGRKARELIDKLVPDYRAAAMEFIKDFDGNRPKGDIVCDRYVDSYSAYCYAYALDVNTINLMDSLEMPKPDILFVLDADPIMLAPRTEGAPHEKNMLVMERARDYFSQIKHAIIIDAMLPKDEIHGIICDSLARHRVRAIS